MHNTTSFYNSHSGLRPIAPKCLVNTLLIERVQTPTNATGLLNSDLSQHLLYGIRRSVAALFVLLLILVGFSTSTFAAEASQSSADTLFGRLSQRFQLGSTEEVITYKLPVGPFFATIRGEVLLGRPAYLDVVLTEQESGAVRSDLDVRIELCQIADETVNYVESCVDFDGPLYQHDLDATWQAGAYRVDGFAWETDGNWHGKMTIADPTTNGVEVVDIWPYVYPSRPASSNLFEIVSVILPFLALGIFLVGLRVISGRFSLQQG